MDNAAVWFPIAFSLGSLIVSWLAFKKAGQSSKEIFINSFRDKIKNAKHFILNMENKQYTQDDKMSILETIQDFLLYQGYMDEKEKFLSTYIRTDLSNLQEELEDIVGLILIQQDVSSNKLIAKSKLNNFFSQL